MHTHTRARVHTHAHIHTHYIHTELAIRTCKELRIAKTHANTCVSLLTASMPIIQVIPSNGKSITAAFNTFL